MSLADTVTILTHTISTPTTATDTPFPTTPRRSIDMSCPFTVTLQPARHSMASKAA